MHLEFNFNSSRGESREDNGSVSHNSKVLTLTTVTSKPDKCKIGAAFFSKRFLALLEITRAKIISLVWCIKKKRKKTN